jgi:hypothetical protein
MNDVFINRKKKYKLHIAFYSLLFGVTLFPPSPSKVRLSFVSCDAYAEEELGP